MNCDDVGLELSSCWLLDYIFDPLKSSRCRICRGQNDITMFFKTGPFFRWNVLEHDTGTTVEEKRIFSNVYVPVFTFITTYPSQSPPFIPTTGTDSNRRRLPPVLKADLFFTKDECVCACLAMQTKNRGNSITWGNQCSHLIPGQVIGPPWLVLPTPSGESFPKSEAKVCHST